MKLTYSQIVARRVRLSTREAAALAAAAARALDAAGPPAPAASLPSLANIVLGSDGRVSVLRRDTALDDEDRTRALGAVLSELMRLDDDAGLTRDVPIPGVLLVLLARALGRIPLPPPTYDDFRAAVFAYGTADESLLATLYWRAAHRTRVAAARSVRPAPGAGGRPRRVGLPLVRERRRPPRRAAVLVHAAPPLSVPRWRRRVGPALLRARHVAAACATLAALVVTGFATRSSGWLPSAALPDVRPVVATYAASAPLPVVAPPAEHDVTPGAVDAPVPIIGAAVAGDLFSPAFSRGGRELVFHAGRESAALMRASLGGDGQILSVQPLLDDGAANYHGVRSPDGRWIAFDSDREGTRGVYVAGPDASRSRRVSGNGYAAVPTWSPDGRQLAFVRADAARPRVWNVWVADVRTGALTQLTHHRTGQAWGASWFPDGRRIAYSVEDALVLVDVRSGASRVFPSPVAGRLVRTPAVSPDGTRVVFQVQREGAWLLDLPSGRTHRLLDDASAEEFAWSQDGSSIVYHARRGNRWSLWRVSMPGPRA